MLIDQSLEKHDTEADSPLKGERPTTDGKE